MNLFYGILWGLLGQIGSFMQFQGAIKYNWNQRYFWPILLMSLPVGYFYMKSVERFVAAFNGTVETTVGEIRFAAAPVVKLHV